MKSLLVLSIISLAISQSPPVWPAQWKSTFIETYANPKLKGVSTTGTFYYSNDANSSRIDRVNGRYEKFCSSIKPDSDEPCTILTVRSLRYIIHPTSNECCTCCDAPHGCGVFPRDWLKGAEFHGYSTGESKRKILAWTKESGPGRDFYLEYEGEGGKRQPEFVGLVGEYAQTYSYENYSEKLDLSIFEIPSQCNPHNICPLHSACAAMMRQRKLAASE